MSRMILTMALLTCAAAAQAEDSIKIESQQGTVIETEAQRGNPALTSKEASPGAKHFLVGICGECHVDSRVNAYIKVYINGRYRGTMSPYGDIYPYVGDCDGECTHLYAVSTCGRYSWRRTVYGSYSNYHWILQP